MKRTLCPSLILGLILTIAVIACDSQPIESAQNYASALEENRAPIITEFTSNMNQNSYMAPFMEVRLYVKAYDPNGDNIQYTFSALQGTFKDQQITYDGSAITYVFPGTLTADFQGKVTVIVTDSSGAFSQKELILAQMVSRNGVPKIVAASSEDGTSIIVSNIYAPEVSTYEIQWKKTDVTEWNTHTITNESNVPLTYTINNLATWERYYVRARSITSAETMENFSEPLLITTTSGPLDENALLALDWRQLIQYGDGDRIIKDHYINADNIDW